jgi:hypothetical protein
MSVADKTKIALITNAEGIAATTGKLYAALPFDNSADPTVTRALNTATRVNSAGNIETVVANRGRISYRLGTNKCPNLLVERSRANLLSFTENLTDIYWTKSNTTIAANTTDTLSPDGLNTADKVLDTVGTLEYRVLSGNFAATPSTTYTISGYFKKGTKSWLWFSFLETSVISNPVYYNFDTGLFGNIAAGCTVNAENVGNGWVRVSITKTIGAGTINIGFHIGMREANGQVSYTGDGTGSLYFWGGQVELGAFATSYIPRLTAAAVTANADVITKTGISSLIPQTKGSIFFDGYLQAGSLSDSASRHAVNIGSDISNRLFIYRFNNTILFDLNNAGVSQGLFSYTIPTPLINKRIKILYYYEINNLKFYVNGSLVGVDTSATLPSFSDIFHGQSIASNNQWDGLIKAVAVTDELDAIEIDQLFQFSSYADMAAEMLYTTD